MENMGITALFNNIYKDKTCLVTGHTGFKGAWLAYWLSSMGARVVGYSLKPMGKFNHFELLAGDYISIIGDIRDKKHVRDSILKHKPDIVFHLAAQALVRRSYKDPVATYETNVLGTLNLFEACRKTSSVKAIINITSDKCYENKEWIRGYRENDPMGGYDPYSSSKGCSELLTSSYRNSFFNLDNYKKKHGTLIASARAGNVIGGGDWAGDRLVPDIVKAASKGEKVEIRNPGATRPWQHTLEPLSGYLSLGRKLLQGEKLYAAGWNFGPDLESNARVSEMVTAAKQIWTDIEYTAPRTNDAFHEADLLMLDCSKANKLLKWKPVWNLPEALKKTIDWYKQFYRTKTINTQTDLFSYIKDARNKGIEWAG